MRQKLYTLALTAAVALALCGGTREAGRASAQTSTPGTWTLAPAQTIGNTTSVRPPIKADGSSVFSALNSSGAPNVLPVKFKLSTSPSPAILESILLDNNDENDVSYLSFEPSGTLLFSYINTLKADYEFTVGNCGGGSLRWSVTLDINNDNHIVDEDTGANLGLFNDRSIFIYYGGYPSFDNCTSGGSDQSGVNMIGLADLRYDSTQLGGSFYGTYEEALSRVAGAGGSDPQPRVASVTLALDSGWQNEPGQRLTLGNAWVNNNQFTPLSGDMTGTCTLPDATINVTKLPGTPVEEPVSVRPRDGNIFFSKAGCQYIYNLDLTSLPGPGDYKVDVIINNQTASGGAFFKLQ